MTRDERPPRSLRSLPPEVASAAWGGPARPEMLLVGSNLALLVAAHELARSGRRAVLVTDRKPIGGHFGGIRVEGRAFDLGMVLLEKLPATEPGASLASYDPSRRNDWTRFADRAALWLDAQQPLRRTPTLQCLVEGRIVADYLVANRLEAFRDAAVAPPAALSRSDARHAAHKNAPGCYDHLSYADAVRCNHGEPLHARFIEPFVRKLLDVSSHDFEARFHRAAWVPLYYPETLTAALRGEPHGLAEYPFWTTASGSIAELVATLAVGLGGSSVRVIDEPIAEIERSASGWTLRSEVGSVCSARGLALGLPAERAHALLGLPPQPAPAAASVTLGMGLVRAAAIGRRVGCLNIVDERYASYRLSDQDQQAGLEAEWHRIVIEASPARLAQRGETAEEVLRRELRELLDLADDEALRLLKTITARNALALPTLACIEQAGAGHAALTTAAPGALLTGALLPHGATSFNDQIIQGLRIAEACA